MANVTHKGNHVTTSGNLPDIGIKAHDFTLVKSDLSNLSLSEFIGKNIILNIFMSLDTSTCAASVRKFNQFAAEKPDSAVLAISKDLPYAQRRFCNTEGIKNLITLSGFRDSDFGKSYGIEIIDGPMRGLYARSIVIIDTSGKISYTQQVPEMSMEPDYDKALRAI